MIDLAVNAAGELWAVSAHDVYQLDISSAPGTVHCAATYALPAGSATFYGLTFAPAGVIDPNSEVLVAADTAGELWALEIVAGSVQLTQHGTFGTVPANDGHGNTYANAGKPWELSGDIAFFSRNGSNVGLATVRDCPNPPSATGCSTTDTLVEIDLSLVATAGTQAVIQSVIGQIVKAPTCSDAAHTSYGSLYGIATNGTDVFGFSHAGNIVQVSTLDGSGCLLQSIASDLWVGAASTSAL
ncbi:MAG: hypothetical protein JST54_01575 [Deltaproteobacteria bacterium]|nr:hypothetical protein [Deltaproteobacteria bacterium]